ncbi:MAG: nucleoside deaminase [Endomicrobium sp.]|nr:nucleoside deaminase [Endomicrobium sp.]
MPRPINKIKNIKFDIMPYMKNAKENIAEKIISRACGSVKKNKLGPFACAVAFKGKIIALTVNCVTKKNDPTAHAEIEAIRKAAKKLKTYNLKNCEIYASCKPCPMCLSAIYWANIKKVYYCADTKTAATYGFKDGFIYEELKKDEDKRKIKLIKVKPKRLDPKQPFKIWKNLSGKKKY